MNLEIERKWLVNIDKIPYDLEKLERISIEQTYISFSPEIRVRNINDGEQYILTIKSNLSSDGLMRDEYEINIAKNEYLNLLIKREGLTIYKNRYKIVEGNKTFEIDVYQKELQGLVCLEIEFETEEEARAYVKPDWVENEVTNDMKYKNSCLARIDKKEPVLQNLTNY